MIIRFLLLMKHRFTFHAVGFQFMLKVYILCCRFTFLAVDLQFVKLTHIGDYIYFYIFEHSLKYPKKEKAID